MKRKVLLYVFIFAIAIISIGCKQGLPDQIENKSVNFYYQDGVTALTVAKLEKENPEIDESSTINYKMQKSPDLLVNSILKEEADIAIVPSNLAAQIFNKDLPYKILGTSTWGTLYLASREDINTFDELKGKEIYAFGKGLTPDLVLRYILSKNGIEIDKDVMLTYVNSAIEVGPIFLNNKRNVAILPEPLLTAITMKDENMKISFSLNEEWANLTGAEKGFPQSSLIIKTELIDNDIEFVENFIKKYNESRLWAIQNRDKLADYAEELEITVSKDVIINGIRWTNPQDFNIEDSILEYESYYKAILDFAPESIGGKIPGEDLYFKK